MARPAGDARSRKRTILVVDDESSFQDTIADYLTGYRRLSAYTGKQALVLLGKHQIDLVLLDLNLPDMSGVQVLEQIRRDRDDVEVLILTGHSDLRSAVQTVKLGAFDFLAKSAENVEQIDHHIERALENRRRRHGDVLARTDENLREALAGLESTRCPAMAEVVDMLRRSADVPLTVLLEGESGVGKELLARYVHLHSDRARESFVAVNLAAVPDTLLESTLFGHEKGAFTGADRQRQGKFELADGGTLFLDEVGELTPQAQVRLLRVLQEREVERIGAAEPLGVDVRVIAATNKDLEREVIEGRFRADLFHRLNVLRLAVPPLRERKADIPALVEILGRRAARMMQRKAPVFTEGALQVLAAYGWPGNIRELENLVNRLVALHVGPEVRDADIPIEYSLDHLGGLAMWHAKRKESDTSLFVLATRHFERFLVQQMIDRSGGNMAEAARRLGVSYTTIKKKLRGADDDG